MRRKMRREIEVEGEEENNYGLKFNRVSKDLSLNKKQDN